MIALLCTMETSRIPWLPQLVQHYRGIGVERFLLTLQLEPEAVAAAKDRDYALFRETLAALGIHEGWRWEHVFEDGPLMAFQYALRDEHTKPGDWIVWCDSDEFQVYPAPLAEMIRQSDAAGVDYVRGVFVDRVAEDYGLAVFDAGTPVWKTYPRTCNVTQALARGDVRKVVLTRAGLQVSGGKHLLHNAENHKTFTGWVQVHHFKWDALVIERLRHRVEIKYHWWAECQRLLDYFVANDMRFRPSDVPTVTLNGPHFVAYQ
jgi:hypothetical protein